MWCHSIHEWCHNTIGIGFYGIMGIKALNKMELGNMALGVTPHCVVWPGVSYHIG